MMRLVVLLAAEERRLLPADDPIYSASYSVLTTREQLERDAMRDGVETLEKRHTAWHRLLATFRAVHGGIEHDRLRLPAYGGSLFDPERYPFLDSPPIPVDDRATLAVLDALAGVVVPPGRRHRGAAAQLSEPRRRTDRPRLRGPARSRMRARDRGRARARSAPRARSPRSPLSDLERELQEARTRSRSGLAEQGWAAGEPTSRSCCSKISIRIDDHRLLAACDNDEATYDRVRPFGGLLRKDLRGLPAVFMPGALYVTQTSLRRDSRHGVHDEGAGRRGRAVRARAARLLARTGRGRGPGRLEAEVVRRSAPI